MTRIQPVILAGGNGYRLWPLSQKTKPKQFIKYIDNLSSFQNTIIRNNYLGVPLVIASITHQEVITEQLAEINAQAKIIFEPDQKNTAICALVGSCYAKSQGFNSIILIPSDHHIGDQANYRHALDMAAAATKKYKFATIGITPTYPNSDFGYIKAEQQLNKNLYLATKFTEKPDKELAKKLITIPEYFWNSGIYFFDIDYILELTERLIPVISEKLSTIFDYALQADDVVTLDKKMYNDLPSLSFDNAISEKIEKMALIKANFKWSDLGTWESIWNLDKNNLHQNNIQGQGIIVSHNVRDSYINSDAEKTVAIDLKNIVIIFKNGQLLVADKNSPDIKQVVTEDIKKHDS